MSRARLLACGVPDQPSDEELMAAYVAGDQQALATLYQRYTPLLLRIIRMQVGNHADGWDVLQQTFVQLHRARLDFRPDARLRPYLTTICSNLCKELYRKRGRRREDEAVESPVSGGQESSHEQKVLAADLRAALDKLPEGQREVIRMHWLADMSFPEIAEATGLGLSAVKVRAHRGYEALRKLLGQHAPPSTT